VPAAGVEETESKAGTLPQRLRDTAGEGIYGGSLMEEAADRIEELETTMRHIDAQECECSENHAYDPACPHTLALLALSNLEGRSLKP
jgi:hypothetical protein